MEMQVTRFHRDQAQAYPNQYWYEVFKGLAESQKFISAHVELYNGEHRLRVGRVANLTAQYVTIFDLEKGFRTTPLALVHEVVVETPERGPLGAFLNWLFGGSK